MRDDVIVIFGGSGFVGRHVVRALAKRDKRIRVVLRRPHLGLDLKVLGSVGQVQLVQANARFPESVARALEGADGVINLIGTMNNRGPQTMQSLNVDAAQTIAEAAAKAGIKRFVQMSALGAAPKGARYFRSKLAGEEAVRAALPEAVVVRPSVIFGPEDSFFNRFAGMAKFASAIPFGGVPVIGGKTKFQPVFAGDIATAIANALDRVDLRGRTFELGGPRTYTMRELLTYVRQETARKVILPGVSFFIAGTVGLLVEWLMKPLPMDPLLTGDQVTMLKRDNIVSADASTFADLGVTQLESVEAIVPSYLWRFRPYGQFQTNQTA